MNAIAAKNANMIRCIAVGFRPQGPLTGSHYDLRGPIGVPMMGNTIKKNNRIKFIAVGFRPKGSLRGSHYVPQGAPLGVFMTAARSRRNTTLN